MLSSTVSGNVAGNGAFALCIRAVLCIRAQGFSKDLLYGGLFCLFFSGQKGDTSRPEP